MELNQDRSSLTRAQRIVIKVGTRVLVDKRGRPDQTQMENLVKGIAALQRQGKEVLLVSSGAVGAGMQALGIATRPDDVAQLQMAAAVGQSKLMALYDRLFSSHSRIIAQVLLTHDDLKNRSRHLNARNTLLSLLHQKVIPIINENDAVSVNEIKFGDNDMLAALVSILVDADTLILLTSAPGFLLDGKRLSVVATITDTIRNAAGNSEEEHLSTGGMRTKLQAVEKVCQVGGRVVIANGSETDILQQIFLGQDKGTLFTPEHREEILERRKRKHWIAFFHKAEGFLTVDDGAMKALVNEGRSLLPIGVKAVAGNFTKGACVAVQSRSGELIAHGLTDYSSHEILRIMGCRTDEIDEKLGYEGYAAVIHRDNLVLERG